MAGDWLKWTKGLGRKPEVLRMADLLKLERRQMAGMLMEFWEWTDDNATVEKCGSGNIVVGALGVDFIDGIAGAAGFANALATVGWLRRQKGRLVFPNFGRHNGEPSKTRALTRDRAARYRERHGAAGAKQTDFTFVRRPENVEMALEYAKAHLPAWGETDVRAWFAHRDGQGWERTSGAAILKWRSDLDAWCLSNARGQNGAATSPPPNRRRVSARRESVYSLTRRIATAEEQITALKADSRNHTYENSQKALKPAAREQLRTLRGKIEEWKKKIAE